MDWVEFCVCLIGCVGFWVGVKFWVCGVCILCFVWLGDGNVCEW